MVAKSAFTLRGLFPWGATRKIRPVVWSLKAQPPTPASYQSATNTEPCSSDRFRVARVSQAIAGHGTEAILPRGSRSVQTESLAREAPLHSQWRRVMRRRQGQGGAGRPLAAEERREHALLRPQKESGHGKLAGRLRSRRDHAPGGPRARKRSRLPRPAGPEKAGATRDTGADHRGISCEVTLQRNSATTRVPNSGDE